jgi:hypothetical protein
MSFPVAEALRDISRVLDRLGIGWYLFGAQAALLRGSRRLTADIDLTLFPGEDGVEPLLAELCEAGLALRVPDAPDFVAATRVLPLYHKATQIPVDLVLGGAGLEEHFLAGSERLDLGGFSVPVPCTEHLVVMKLLAGRAKDLDDALAMVRTSRPDLQAVEDLVDAIAVGLGEDDIRASLTELRARLGSSAP